MTVKFGFISSRFHKSFLRSFRVYHTQPFKRHYSLSTNETKHYKKYDDCKYDACFSKSINNPVEFWTEAADKLTWHKKWTKILDNSSPPFSRWFVGGELNTCYNAVDRHVENGHGQQIAIIHDSPLTGTISTVTYKELLSKVSQFAGVLSHNGVRKGDRVVIYMPMIPEAVVSMLASARLGAIHCLVFGGFSAKELAVRIEHAKPKVLVTVNCGVEPGRIINYKDIVDDAVTRSNNKPSKCIVYNRPMFDTADMVPGVDLDFDEFCNSTRPHDPVPVPATDPIYILHTSGTTGTPKAVVRPSGGHAVALNWTMSNIYGIQPHEVWWSASDLGWVVGHSYIAYAPLLNCNTTVIYEGKPVGTPDASSYFRVLKHHGVSGLFLAPTALRVLRQADESCESGKKYRPLDALKYIFVAGEHCDHDTRTWASNAFGVPVLDNWWQTETGWAITATLTGLGMNLNPPHGVTGKPVPSWNVDVLSLDGRRRADPDELGRIVVKLPMPPGALSTLWENEDKFKTSYFSEFPGYYDTMDTGYRSDDGYISVMARSDDVINVAGHRISAASLEEVLLSHPDIVDTAVVGIPDEIKGQLPVGFCVLNSISTTTGDQLQQEVTKLVRENIGPIASFKHIVIVPGLPKTRSGKTARHSLQVMVTGKQYQIPVTIQDPEVYSQIENILRSGGILPPQGN